jgi:hypothetical protein
MVCDEPETEWNRLEHHHIWGRSQTGIPAEILDSVEAGVAVGSKCCHDDFTNPTGPKHRKVDSLRRASFKAITGRALKRDEDPLGALRQWWADQSPLERPA